MNFNDWHHQFIAGTWRTGKSENTYTNRNPFNDKSLVQIQLANEDDIHEAYESAQRAQVAWRDVNAYDKSAMMERAAAILQQRRQEIVDILVQESGSTQGKANLEVDITIGIVKESASFPLRMNGLIMPSHIPGKENRIYKSPVGVVGVISPFNFPLFLSMRSIAPALACGNGVVVKPDLQTFISGGLIIGKVFEEAGLPSGLLNVTVADITEIGDHFTEHPIPRIISFTGSTAVGRRIGEICGRNLKRVALELGGNNALIVLEDADVERAAQSAAFGKFIHSGQICMALNRIIVHSKVYDQFLEAFRKKAVDVRVGDPSSPETAVGPLINRRQVDRILHLIDKSVAEGARVVVRGKAEGNLLYPYILADVTNDMPIAQSEIFGPAIGVIRAESEEDAIRIANDTVSGLSGAVHSGSIEHGVEVARRIHTGMIHVNDQSVNDEAIIAFGGEKSSGLGRSGGEWAIDTYTTTQWVSIQQSPRVYPF